MAVAQPAVIVMHSGLFCRTFALIIFLLGQGCRDVTSQEAIRVCARVAGMIATGETCDIPQQDGSVRLLIDSEAHLTENVGDSGLWIRPGDAETEIVFEVRDSEGRVGKSILQSQFIDQLRSPGGVSAGGFFRVQERDAAYLSLALALFVMEHASVQSGTIRVERCLPVASVSDVATGARRLEISGDASMQLVHDARAIGSDIAPSVRRAERGLHEVRFWSVDVVHGMRLHCYRMVHNGADFRVSKRTIAPRGLLSIP